MISSPLWRNILLIKPQLQGEEKKRKNQIRQKKSRGSQRANVCLWVHVWFPATLPIAPLPRHESVVSRDIPHISPGTHASRCDITNGIMTSTNHRSYASGVLTILQKTIRCISGTPRSIYTCWDLNLQSLLSPNQLRLNLDIPGIVARIYIETHMCTKSIQTQQRNKRGGSHTGNWTERSCVCCTGDLTPPAD